MRRDHEQKGKGATPPHSPIKTKQRKPQLFCETTFKGLNMSEAASGERAGKEFILWQRYQIYWDR